MCMREGQRHTYTHTQRDRISISGTVLSSVKLLFIAKNTVNQGMFLDNGI